MNGAQQDNSVLVTRNGISKITFAASHAVARHIVRTCSAQRRARECDASSLYFFPDLSVHFRGMKQVVVCLYALGVRSGALIELLASQCECSFFLEASKLRALCIYLGSICAMMVRFVTIQKITLCDEQKRIIER